MKRREMSSRFIVPALALMLLTPFVSAFPQDSATSAAPPQPASLADSVAALAERVQELNASVTELRSEVTRSHEENTQLRQELQETLKKLDGLTSAPAQNAAAKIPSQAMQPGSGENAQAVSATSAPPASAVASNNQDRVQQIEDNQELLESKVNDQYQTKVESASKYRVKLSGIALLNIFENGGNVDNSDVPSWASPRGPLDTGGSFGATVRQSEIGLEVFGPDLAGAKASANIQMDFFGGSPQTIDGATFGLARIRVATARLDWSKTSLVVGQDTPFFSPLSPASIASLAIPALAYAGNLWTWLPQVRVEHRFDISELSRFSIQGGILDPLDGEVPSTQLNRTPQAGEKSRQPGYGTRLEWQHGSLERPLTLGVGGYYSRQDYGAQRDVDSWAGTADLSVPLDHWLTWTGEFYRGRGIGGLGGGIGRSIVSSGPVTDPTSLIIGLNDIGGWQQLSFKPVEALQFNAAVGLDNPFAADMLRFPGTASNFYSSISRNQTSMFNVIYRPRTDLLFSIEYRHMNTLEIDGDKYTANHVNLSVGVLF